MYRQVVKQEHHIKIGQMETKILFSLRYILALLCVVMYVALSGQPSPAQDTPLPPDPERGMIFKDGAWRTPTAAEAMQILMNLSSEYDNDSIESGEITRAEYVLFAVIQQGLEVQSSINLDAFVSDLFQIWLEETGWRSEIASQALRDASFRTHHDGSLYPGVANELIRIYESIDDYPGLSANDVLLMLSECGDIYPECIGINYVRNVFNSTPKPPVCSRTSNFAPDNPCPNISPWCDAGKFLIGQPGGPDREEWEALCKSDKEFTAH